MMNKNQTTYLYEKRYHTVKQFSQNFFKSITKLHSVKAEIFIIVIVYLYRFVTSSCSSIIL